MNLSRITAICFLSFAIVVLPSGTAHNLVDHDSEGRTRGISSKPKYANLDNETELFEGNIKPDWGSIASAYGSDTAESIGLNPPPHRCTTESIFEYEIVDRQLEYRVANISNQSLRQQRKIHLGSGENN